MRLNLHRRHLSSEERKVLYLKLREMRGVREHGFNRHNLDVTKVTSTTPSQTTYASEMGVSRKTVNDWESDAKILDKSPDLKEAVLAGKMPVAEIANEMITTVIRNIYFLILTSATHATNHNGNIAQK